MCKLEAIIAELNKRFMESDSNRCIEIEMKQDKRKLQLTLCSETDPMNETPFVSHPGGILDYDWIIVEGKGVAIGMSGEPLRVCRLLQDYAGTLARYHENVEKCKAYADKHRGTDPTEDDTEGYGPICFYSDWHKELFGYRPNGWEFNARNVETA